jgi:outer membrane protein insertion porin family
MRSFARCVTVLVWSLLCVASAFAFDAFKISDIRIEGLQRISLGTVLNYLPVNIGDTFTDSRSADTIRALFKTGFFDKVAIGRRGDVLVISVDERPAIANISISGNKDIETDKLKEALKSVGLVEGRVFDRSTLDKVEREIENQYFSQGKYGVKVASKVTPQESNRVDVSIEISEGSVATIRQINIVGNAAFNDEVLRGKFQLSAPTMFSLFSSSDQYSRRKLAADLETLRSYYLDNGYINFSIDSTQVSITPDKRDVYVTINVTEGEQYRISDVQVAGDLVVPASELKALVTVKPQCEVVEPNETSFHAGDQTACERVLEQNNVAIVDGKRPAKFVPLTVFSRKQATESAAAIGERLGNEGFAFANINPIPKIDKDDRTVALTFFVDPGKRIYVHRIEAAGNLKTEDEVIRREIRQMEGGWIATDKVNRSRVRLQRLGFFDEVNVETPSVPGVEDQVDVNFAVKERPSGTLMAGMGYSQTQGFLVNASVSQNNLFGTGKRVSVTINNSAVNRIYSFDYTNPYFTLDGVSRGFKVYSRATDAGAANVSDYTSNVYGGSVDFGFPINEYNTADVSLTYENTKLNLTSSSPPSYLGFVAKNGDKFGIFKVEVGFSHDTRNRAIFPDQGVYHSISTETALPRSGLEYYKVRYRGIMYVPLSDIFTLSFRGDVGYGDSYGATTELPFFEHYYAGGSNSVRGYRGNSLGPREFGNPQGGALKLVGGTELVFPSPFGEDNNSLRLSTFFDIGNVYQDAGAFNAGELRYSVGVAAMWYTPIAPMTFSFSWPLNNRAGDELERFQFTLGSSLF